MAAEQFQYDPQKHSDHRTERNLDPVDLILLLLSLIILLNLGINVMILIWRSFTRSLHRTFDFFQSKGNIPKKPQQPTKKPLKVPTLCIHCTLDPVALNVAHPTSNEHRHRQHSGSCNGSFRGSHRGSRRGNHRGSHRGSRRGSHHSHHESHHGSHHGSHHSRQRQRSSQQQHHHPQTSLTPPPPPPSPATSPTSFCHQETWDTDLDDKEPWNTISHPGNIRHYRGYWSSYYPMSSNLSSPDLKAPRRVEAKSELRLETYYQPSPNSWSQNLKENVESSPIPKSPQFIPKFPTNPSWMPGTHNPFPQGGQIFYDGWEVRQKARDGSRGTDVSKTPPSVPRSYEPHSYAENVVPRQAVRRITVPLISAHPPLNRTHVSAGHLPLSSRNRPEIKRWDREHGEPMPRRSPSLSRLPNHETQTYHGTVLKENLLPEVSQPLSYVSVRVPAPDSSRTPAFIPLSRNPGGLTNYPVFDSQELKRQIQEGRRYRGTADPRLCCHLKASLRILLHHFWGKDQKRCQPTCICHTMDPKSQSPRGSPHSHEHQTCLMGPSHSLDWAPDTDDEKVSQCQWLPPQCGHCRDPRSQGKGLVTKAGKFIHSQSAGVSTIPLLRPETLFYPGQKPQNSKNSEDIESQSARDVQKSCQVFLSSLHVPHPLAGHVVYDAKKMKVPNCQVGGFVEALSLSTGGCSQREVSEKGQNLTSQTLKRASNLPIFSADHPVELKEYREQRTSFPEGRNKGTFSSNSKSQTDKGYSERKILLPPNSANLQPSDYLTFPYHTSASSQYCCTEISPSDQTPLHQQSFSKVPVEPLEVSKGQMAYDKQKRPEVSTLTETHCPQGWKQNWVYKSLEMTMQNRPSLHSMPPNKGSGLATGHVVFDARQLRLNKEQARDSVSRAYGPETPLMVPGKCRGKTENTNP